jgi:hypothetical protein
MRGVQLPSPRVLVVPIANDIRVEAERLTEAALTAKLGLRLMGGLAVWLLSPSVRMPPFARDYGDLDFAVRQRDSRAVTPFLQLQGYLPERLFNSIHGAQRLNFSRPDGLWTIDVVVDALRMSHQIDLRGRLEPGLATIGLADLLLTKLQVWEINAKDLGDITCLLADLPISAEGVPANADAIDRSRILALTGRDWGLSHTLERNLRDVAAFARERRPEGARFDPAEQAEALLAAIVAGPKSLGWRARGQIGERVRWYETPEEVRH